MPLYAMLVVGAVAVIPLQHAFILPEPFPVKLPTDILLLLALPAYVLRSRRVTPSWRMGTDATVVLLLALIVVLSGLIGFASDPGSEQLREYSESPEFDLFWFTTRALIVVAVWFAARTVGRSRLETAFVAATWIMLAGVLLQQLLMALGYESVLSSFGFNTVTSGIFLDGGTSSQARSGTFPNGQELGFFAGAMIFVTLSRRRYFAAIAAAYCLVYSLSTTGFLGVAAGIVVLAIVGRARRARLAVVLASLITIVALLVSPYLQALAEFQLAKIGLIDSSIRQAGQSLEIRSIKTDLAFSMMRDNPILGVGASRFGNHVGEYSASGLVPSRTLVTVENSYAQLGAEHGILALAVFGALLAHLAWASWRSANYFATALVVFVAVGAATQSTWTASALWLILAYVSSAIGKQSSISGELPALIAPGADRDFNRSTNRSPKVTK